MPRPATPPRQAGVPVGPPDPPVAGWLHASGPCPTIEDRHGRLPRCQHRPAVPSIADVRMLCLQVPDVARWLACGVWCGSTRGVVWWAVACWLPFLAYGVSRLGRG